MQLMMSTKNSNNGILFSITLLKSHNEEMKANEQTAFQIASQQVKYRI